MHPWYIYKRARVVHFSLTAILSAAWAILVSVFTAMSWGMFMKMGRGIIIGLISLSGGTALLLFLMMISGYFYKWEVVRLLLLVGLHAAGAVLITTLGSGFPCSASGNNCQAVHLIVMVGQWAITGLLVLYAMFLPVIPYIPRPEKKDYLAEAKAASASRGRHAPHSSVDSGSTLIDEEKGIADGMVGERMYLEVPGLQATLQVSTVNGPRPMASNGSMSSVYSTDTGKTTPSMKSPTTETNMSRRPDPPASSAPRVQFSTPPTPRVRLPASPTANLMAGRPMSQPYNVLPRLNTVPPRSSSIHITYPARYGQGQIPPLPQGAANIKPAPRSVIPPTIMPFVAKPPPAATNPSGNMAGIGAQRMRSMNDRSAPQRPPPLRSMTMGAQPPPLGFRQDIYAPELSAPFYAGRPPPLPAGAMRPNPPNAQQWNIQGGPADIRRFRSTPNQGGSYSDSESGQGVRRVPRTPAAARRPGSVAAVDPAAWARLVLDAANGNRI